MVLEREFLSDSKVGIHDPTPSLVSHEYTYIKQEKLEQELTCANTHQVLSTLPYTFLSFNHVCYKVRKGGSNDKHESFSIYRIRGQECFILRE